MLMSPIIISILFGPLSSSCFTVKSPFGTIISLQSSKALDYDLRQKNNRNDKRSATTSQFCNNRPLKALSTNYLTNRLLNDNEEWEAMFPSLVEFQEREGHLLVPHDDKDSEKKCELLSLGLWLKKQRQKEKEGNLDFKQKHQLQEIGIVWNLKDQKWEDSFRLTMEFKEREGHCNIPRYHKEKGKNLGEWVSNQRNWKRREKLLPTREERLKEIGFVFDQLGNSWDKMYQNLQMFKEREGHSIVPVNHKENGKMLGQWLMFQRKKKRIGKLQRLHEEKLTKIGVEYDSLVEQRWESMFQLLLEFQNREGHCLVPRYHKENGQNLGVWLATLEQSMKDGKLDSFHEIKLLDAGVILRWKNRDALWGEMFQLLLRFKEREGHCIVPTDHEENERNLGIWVSLQRRKKVHGNMKASREERLQEAGFIFAVDQNKWENMLQLLLKFKEREGHCNVRQSHMENGRSLGRWVTFQRSRKAIGKMNVVREEQLREAGFIFAVEQNNWEEMFQLLLKFKEREGHCCVPAIHEENGRNLGMWSVRQRAKKREGKLDPTRKKLLLENDFVWSLQNSQRAKQKEGKFDPTRKKLLLENYVWSLQNSN